MKTIHRIITKITHKWPSKIKKTIKKSEQIVADIESEARKQGKMTVLSDALEAARGVMGERGYNKSGRLLLLQ